MSSTALEKLRTQILRLPEAERAELAHELVKGLDAPADAWDKEISKRLAEIDSGAANLVDRDELRHRDRARIDAR